MRSIFFLVETSMMALETMSDFTTMDEALMPALMAVLRSASTN